MTGIKINGLGYEETVFRDRQGVEHDICHSACFTVNGECSALTFLCRDQCGRGRAQREEERGKSVGLASAETGGSRASGSGKGLELGGI